MRLLQIDTLQSVSGLLTSIRCKTAAKNVKSERRFQGGKEMYKNMLNGTVYAFTSFCTIENVFQSLVKEEE